MRILPNSLWMRNAGDGRDPEHAVAVISLAAEEPSPVLPPAWYIATSR